MSPYIEIVDLVSVRVVEDSQSDLEALQDLRNRGALFPVMLPTALDETPHIVCQAPFDEYGADVTTRASTFASVLLN